MRNYPRKPYSINVEGNVYTIHEQEKNKFFVTHEMPHNPMCSFVEMGIFFLSFKKTWHVEGESNINKSHRPGIFQAIESRTL